MSLTGTGAGCIHRSEYARSPSNPDGLNRDELAKKAAADNAYGLRQAVDGTMPRGYGDPVHQHVGHKHKPHR